MTAVHEVPEGEAVRASQRAAGDEDRPTGVELIVSNCRIVVVNAEYVEPPASSTGLVLVSTAGLVTLRLLSQEVLRGAGVATETLDPDTDVRREERGMSTDPDSTPNSL